ncbi:MAG TPA: periplasmic heavy metal sensor [Thermoanaerobaculia bacterium]|nr:periplasmic heavy metal sensor [Thermoanaerobaculia bacterium]
MTRRLMLAATLVLAAAFASAQNLPPGKWWQRQEIVRELQLTPEQQDKLDEIFRAAANGLIDAKAEVEKLQIAMRSEIDRPQIRRADIMRIAKQLGAARGVLFEREIAMMLEMHGVLNEQQWNRMRAVLDRREEFQQQQRQRQMQRRKP